jgi:hypothetical protein
MLNATRCSLLDHPRLVSQLCSLERRTSRGGQDSIDHAPSAHDDICNAVAGVLLLAGQHAPMKVSQSHSKDRGGWSAAMLINSRRRRSEPKPPSRRPQTLAAVCRTPEVPKPAGEGLP